MLKSTELERFQNKSYLSHIHPFVKIYFLSIISFLLIIVSNFEALLTLNAFVLLLLLTGNFSYKIIISSISLVLIVIYSTIFSQSLFYNNFPKTLWFKVYIYNDVYLKFWEEGISYGFINALRLTAPMLLSFIVYSTTSTAQFLKAFQSIKLPFEIRFMLTTALRFIPIFIEDYKTVRKVQYLKGYRFSFIHLFKSISTETKLFQPVFFHALRNSQTLAESVLGRGYHSNIQNQTTTIDLKLKERISLYIISLLLLVVLIIKFLFFLYINNIYYLSEFRYLYMFNRSFL